MAKANKIKKKEDILDRLVSHSTEIKEAIKYVKYSLDAISDIVENKIGTMLGIKKL